MRSNPLGSLPNSEGQDPFFFCPVWTMEVNFSATVMIFACKARHSIREIPDYLLQIPLRAGIVLGSHLKVLTLADSAAAFLGRPVNLIETKRCQRLSFLGNLAVVQLWKVPFLLDPCNICRILVWEQVSLHAAIDKRQRRGPRRKWAFFSCMCWRFRKNPSFHQELTSSIIWHQPVL